MTPPRIPKLASDVARSWVLVLAAMPIAIALPVILVLADVKISQDGLLATTLFVYWAAMSSLTALTTWLVFRRASGSELRRWLVATNPTTARNHFWYALNGGGAAGWAVSGSIVAVAAVLVLSFNPEFRQQPLVVYSGIAVVVTSLLMTIVAFALRYAREYVGQGGIEFSGDTEPVFMDFIYLAVQVATTFSASDVAITSTKTRRLVTANSLTSFSFNTVIIALLVSVLVTASVQ